MEKDLKIRLCKGRGWGEGNLYIVGEIGLDVLYENFLELRLYLLLSWKFYVLVEII